MFLYLERAPVKIRQYIACLLLGNTLDLNFQLYKTFNHTGPAQEVHFDLKNRCIHLELKDTLTNQKKSVIVEILTKQELSLFPSVT
ncbi:hypothetical protein H0X06_00105 [Candidatus Dependentiae bacterium]|nr:hypothetical protein [Candidatus Dependentiae bacterium]